jgi:hypothetical protein
MGARGIEPLTPPCRRRGSSICLDGAIAAPPTEAASCSPQGVSEIDLGLLERYPEFVAWRSQSKGGGDAEEIGSRDDAEESIASNFELLNAELARNIVGRVHSFSQPSSSASSSTSWCVWATAAGGLRWAGRLAGLAMVA